MSVHASGLVDAQGRPSLPAELRDLVAAGLDADDVQLDADVEKKLEEVWAEIKTGGDARLTATYKIELAFTENRSVHAAFGGFIYAVSNGGYAHGGGDEGIYFCTATVDRDGVARLCNAPLRPIWVGRDAAVCPICRQATKPKDLVGQVYAKLTFQGWGTLLEHMFHKLGCDADVRLGVMRGDLRQASAIEAEQHREGEDLIKVRVEREWVVYPLTNIIKDTAAGATLSSRLRSFLKA